MKKRKKLFLTLTVCLSAFSLSFALPVNQALAETISTSNTFAKTWPVKFDDFQAGKKNLRQFVCSDQRTELRQQIMAIASHAVDPAPEQKKAIKDLKNALNQNDRLIAKSCASLDKLEGDLFEGMKSRKIILNTALDVMNNTQPHIQTFYNSLNETQKTNLIEVFPNIHQIL